MSVAVPDACLAIRDIGFNANAATTDFVWLNSLSAEHNRDLIRAGHCAGFTDFVSVSGLAPTSGGVGMEAVVRRSHPHNPVAVDVDLPRNRSTPG